MRTVLEVAGYSGVPLLDWRFSGLLFRRLRLIPPGPCRNISTTRGELREVSPADL